MHEKRNLSDEKSDGREEMTMETDNKEREKKLIEEMIMKTENRETEKRDRRKDI